ncbi:MAG: DUF4214 domain-containing protein [Lachnospiraceae bacterium]|nr:DUF4214 domain-containing protein [Lachnospiraceae bacterium]
MEELYSNLYDIVNRNIQEAGGSFLTTKPVFLEMMCKNDSEEVDIDHLYHLEGDYTREEYLNIVYIAVLDRIASSADIEIYRKQFSMPEAEYRKNVLKNVVYSMEAKVKAKPVINAGILKVSLGSRMKANVLSFMYWKIYSPLPAGCKSVVKKCLRRQ